MCVCVCVCNLYAMTCTGTVSQHDNYLLTNILQCYILNTIIEAVEYRLCKNIKIRLSFEKSEISKRFKII